jgi:hypothetical protein
MHSDEAPTTVVTALRVSQIVWPDFMREHGCVFLGWHSGSNPPPPSDTLTGWESFVNHTHVFDEFANDAANVVTREQGEEFAFEEVAYNDQHPDFIAGCELGQRIAKLWALKLKLDFPSERFRVYYTQYDNPIIRFHKVRDNEPYWLSDEALQTATDPSFRNAIILDTARLHVPTRAHSESIH